MFLQAVGVVTLTVLGIAAVAWLIRLAIRVYEHEERLNNQSETIDRRCNKLGDDIWALKRWRDEVDRDAKELLDSGAKIVVKPAKKRKATL